MSSKSFECACLLAHRLLYPYKWMEANKPKELSSYEHRVLTEHIIFHFLVSFFDNNHIYIRLKQQTYN